MNEKIEEKIRIFDLVEVNLSKINKIWDKISKYFNGKSDTEDYDILIYQYHQILNNLPEINGFTPSADFMDKSELTKALIDIDYIDDYEFSIDTYEKLNQPEKDIRHYTYLLKKKRFNIASNYITEYLNEIKSIVDSILEKYKKSEDNKTIDNSDLKGIDVFVKNIEFLLGRSQVPKRWSDLKRHINFHLKQDIIDIKNNDLPEIIDSFQKIRNSDSEPIEINIKSFDDISNESSSKNITIPSLQWNELDEDAFERVIFNLISTSSDYENPKWLTKTRAPDRGRDLSVDKIIHDSLMDTRMLHVVIQCKHWLSNSISPKDLIIAVEQLETLKPKVIDTLIFVTSGRFTSDAVIYVDNRNSQNKIPRIELWSDSHLEKVLMNRPDIIEEFKLR